MENQENAPVADVPTVGTDAPIADVPTTGTKAKQAAVPAPVADAPPTNSGVSIYATEQGFKLAQRAMTSLMAAATVPEIYRNNLPNSLAAYEMANRMGLSVQTVMNNLDLIHGRACWKSTFIISAVNSCGLFGGLRFEFFGEPNTDAWSCRAWARDLLEGDKAVGPIVSIDIAKREGWYTRKGSKWQTMPELMLMYRAATWFGRLYAPQLLNGMQTADEIIDITHDVVATNKLNQRAALNAKLLKTPLADAPVEYADAVDVTAEPVDNEIGI
jgi:hypothetical protein